MQNIEIKTRLPSLEQAEQKARDLQARFVGLDRQTDTYFRVPEGRLKLRESSLNGCALIPYFRQDSATARRSDYLLLPVAQPDVLKELLTRMFGQRLVVQKERRIYLWQNVRIHLDAVRELGTFLELEAVVDSNNPTERCRQKVAFLLDHFGIAPGQYLACSYVDLLESLQTGNHR